MVVFNNEELPSVLNFEFIRLKSKNLWYIIGILIIYIFTIKFPQIMLKNWNEIFQITESPEINFAILQITAQVSSLFISNFMFFIIYKLNLNFFENYKIEKKKLWPWRENYSNFISQFKKSLIFVSINVSISILFNVVVGLTKKLEYKYEVRNFPSTIEILVHLFFFMIVEDFAFYFTHRMFHNPMIYQKFHKIHHEYKHTISFSFLHAHPFEFFFGNFIPVILGPMILMKKVHTATLILWNIIRVFETADGHSGYDFPWSPFRLLPFSGTAEYHNYHHSHNVGNFSSFFTWMDTLLGTNRVIL